MLTNETSVLLRAIQRAGNEIAKLQREGFTAAYKANHDPLTTADLAANQILQEELLGCFPHDGWLSEETVDNFNRLHCKRVWVVDPIDGTKEYILGIPEYAISVALIEAGIPILAAVFNPATNELYHAIKNQGAWLNHYPIKCNCSSQMKLTILASRTEFANGDWNSFAEQNVIKPMGSIAYKLALIASGKAHATFSLGPKSEWDIAAGVLLVQQAGGIATDQYQRDFTFNQLHTRVNSIVASSQEIFPIIYAQIKTEARGVVYA